MKNVRKTTSSISIAILLLFSLYATMLLSSLFVTPVAAADVLSTPIGETINVTRGENFTLPFLMKFDNGTVGTNDGYFSITFYWDVNETDPNDKYWNFTYESNIAKFVDDTAFSGAINVLIDKEVPYGYPSGYYRYTVQVYEAYGEAYGTTASSQDFWVNVTMRAAGQDSGSYINHTIGEQNITIVNARCYEDNTVESGLGIVTIDVVPIPGVDVAVSEVKTYSTVHGQLGTWHGGPGGGPPLTPVTVVFETWTVDIDVTVLNNGTGTQTFTVKAYAGNATGNYTIGTPQPVILDPGANITKTFTWDVPTPAYVYPYWTFTIYGEATLEDDTKPENNVKVANVVTVRWLGDATGDGKVNIYDLTKLAIAWKKAKTDPKYNPYCDFAKGDGEVNIYDLTKLAIWWKKGPAD